MNLSIILYQPYPYGMACTNRIHNYAKGINEQGGSAKILIPKPTELTCDSAKNISHKGIYKSVVYLYTCGTTVRPSSFIGRRLANARGVVGVLKEIYCDRNNLNAILLVTNNLLPILLFSLFAKVCGINVLLEKSELPFYNKLPNSLFVKCYQYLYTTYCYKLFDGVIVISKTLHDYFAPKIRSDAALLLVPVIMDPDEFAEYDAIENNYITYCGNFTQRQDGVLTLIKAFKIILCENSDIKLRLVGESSNVDDMNVVFHLIKELNLIHHIEITGYVTREKLVEYVMSARVLVLAKPQSLQSDFCFPSKLAEYLMTGNPVVTTKTGAIQNYLIDDENSYLTKPDCVECLVERISDVLNDKIKSNKIGEAGRKLALEEFSYRKQSGRIINFVDTLSVSKSI